MNYKLNYIRLLTTNFRQMYDFYVEKLGMTPRFNEKNGPYEEFVNEGATLSLFDKQLMDQVLGKEETSKTTPKSADTIAVIFSVPNVDDFYKQNKDKINFVVKPVDRPDWRIRTVHARDPDGNLLEFNQPL